MSAPWEPCCPRCRRALVDVPDDADPAVLGACPVHGDVQAGAEWWGEPITEATHRLAAATSERPGPMPCELIPAFPEARPLLEMSTPWPPSVGTAPAGRGFYIRWPKYPPLVDPGRRFHAVTCTDDQCDPGCDVLTGGAR